jgi:hypothetical protein
MSADKKHEEITPDSETGTTLARRPYSPPRLEKRRSLKRVTLLSGMGALGMGVISMMN